MGSFLKKIVISSRMRGNMRRINQRFVCVLKQKRSLWFRWPHAKLLLTIQMMWSSLTPILLSLVLCASILKTLLPGTWCSTISIMGIFFIIKLSLCLLLDTTDVFLGHSQGPTPKRSFPIYIQEPTRNSIWEKKSNGISRQETSPCPGCTS